MAKKSNYRKKSSARGNSKSSAKKGRRAKSAGSRLPTKSEMKKFMQNRYGEQPVTSEE